MVAALGACYGWLIAADKVAVSVTYDATPAYSGPASGLAAASLTSPSLQSQYVGVFLSHIFSQSSTCALNHPDTAQRKRHRRVSASEHRPSALRRLLVHRMGLWNGSRLHLCHCIPDSFRPANPLVERESEQGPASVGLQIYGRLSRLVEVEK